MLWPDLLMSWSVYLKADILANNDEAASMANPLNRIILLIFNLNHLIFLFIAPF